MERARKSNRTAGSLGPQCRLAIGVLALLFCGCEGKPKEPIPPPLPAAPAPPSPPKPESIPYTTYALTGSKALRDLQEALGPEAFADVLKLNRLSLTRALKGTTLVVPTEPRELMSQSPFPGAAPVLKELPQALLVSVRVQAWAAYESGTLVRWGPVSSGKKSTPTPVGLYHTNWKQKQRTSTFNEEWLLKWYVNLQSDYGVSFHEYELPGFPESHSCVRLSPDDAEWIYRWCQTWALSEDQRQVLQEGTPVIVFGAFDWDGPRPWSLLAEDPSACSLGAGEMEEAWRVLRERILPEFTIPETP